MCLVSCLHKDDDIDNHKNYNGEGGGRGLYTGLFPLQFYDDSTNLAIIAAFFPVDDNLFAELCVRTILLSPVSYILAAKRLHSTKLSEKLHSEKFSKKLRSVC